MASGAPDWWIQGLIPMAWVNLVDTPGDYVDRAGLVPKVNAGESALEFSDAKIDDHKARHKYSGADEIDVSGLTPGPHEASHRNGSTDVLLHNNMARGASDHHTKFTAAEARAAINDIFGADGKADKDIDIGNYILKGTHMRFGHVIDETQTMFMGNAYYDDPNFRYIVNGAACLIQFVEATGALYYSTAIIGVAAALISWNGRFTLNINGNLSGVATYDGIYLSKPVIVAPCEFMPSNDTIQYEVSGLKLENRGTFAAQYFYATLQLPHGKTVSRLDLYCYRDDPASSVWLNMYRTDRELGQTAMAELIADWTDGYGSIADTSIVDAVIDNDTYVYYLLLRLQPNNAVADVHFTGAKISFA